VATIFGYRRLDYRFLTKKSKSVKIGFFWSFFGNAGLGGKTLKGDHFEGQGLVNLVNTWGF